MPRWLDKLWNRPTSTASPTSATKESLKERAEWLAAGAPGNPFSVPILDLMMLQGVIATSTDPTCAARSVSWGDSVGDELSAESLLGLPAIACVLRYPAAKSLPDGILYAPPSMDFKWVLALRDGRVLVARSWTGAVEATLDARLDGDSLVLERLRVAEKSHLRVCSRLVDVIDWLFRTHVWDQRLPLPVDDACATTLENAPLSGFGPFGKALFCAAKEWSPPPPPRPLRSDGEVIRAARKGDLAAIQKAVSQGADIDALGTRGRNALHVAVIQGGLAFFDALVKLGANPSALTDGGNHALGIAVVHKAPQALLDRIASTGANITLPNADGFTALHAAAESDNAAVIPWLLAQGLALETRTHRGHTALHIACALGHVEAARALIAAGADRQAPSPEGTPREVAVAQHKHSLVALLDER